MNRPVPTGSSRAVTGCLFGAVGIFVVLLLVMIFLAYARFREATSNDPVDAGPTGIGYFQENHPQIPSGSGTIPSDSVDHFLPDVAEPGFQKISFDV